MSVQLLDKTRKINKLLHNNTSNKFLFDDICAVLSEVLDSNAMVLSQKGKVLGIKNKSSIQPLDKLIENQVGKLIDSSLNERFLNVLSTMENVNLTTFGFEDAKEQGYNAIIAPIDISGERLVHCFS